MEKTVQVDQVFTANWPAPVDKYGNESKVQEDSIKFVSDDEEIATIEADPENGPYAAKIRTKSKPGTTLVRITADAEVGEEVKEIEGTITVIVNAGNAVGFGEATTGTPAEDDDAD